MKTDDKVTCRTPNAEGVTRLPRWKYDCVRRAILDAVDAAGARGLAFKDLSAEVKSRLSKEELKDLGSVGWHATSVKLEMEVSGEIARVARVSPQRIVRTSDA